MPQHRMGNPAPQPNPQNTLTKEGLLAEAKRRNFAEHLNWSEADIQRWADEVLDIHPGHKTEAPREAPPVRGQKQSSKLTPLWLWMHTRQFGKPAWERALSWLYCAVLLALILLIAVELRGADPVAPPPKAISIEDREPIKDLQFRAAMSLAKLNDATAKRAQADLEADRAQRDLDIANQQIDAATASLRVKYSAPAELWDINPSFLWTPKKRPEPTAAPTPPPAASTPTPEKENK